MTIELEMTIETEECFLLTLDVETLLKRVCPSIRPITAQCPSDRPTVCQSESVTLSLFGLLAITYTVLTALFRR